MESKRESDINARSPRRLSFRIHLGFTLNINGGVPAPYYQAGSKQPVLFYLRKALGRAEGK